ncbi:hypothetical protein GGS20DRAFT_570745 [Poronia punctata]|nr:hypothetical protein GGS20DRAFT_570745 [Poronia punctata]
MAIYSAVPPPPELGGGQVNHQAHENGQQLQQQEGNSQVANTSTNAPPPLPTHPSGVDIEAWTVEALQSLSVSQVARGTGASLSIPLDETEKINKPSVSIYDARAGYGGITPPRRPLSRRDSLKRREALLKGNEGSRQRRRWENDRLLHVPNAVPPEPEDYLPRPTHPVHHVPYKVAAAWELRVRAEVESRTAAEVRRKQALTRTLGDEDVAGRVPRELCQRAKKTPAVRAWVRSLEEPVRRYLVEREGAREDADDAGLRTDDSSDSLDSEDEEIVFVGRDGSMRDGKRKNNVGGQWKKAHSEKSTTGAMQDEGMLFDSLGDEDGGAFRRWITHSISEYYGLQSRSVVVGNPTRKVVYVGIKQMKTGRPTSRTTHLPRPLWELC